MREFGLLFKTSERISAKMAQTELARPVQTSND